MQTIFAIGSNSKLFAALSVALLVTRNAVLPSGSLLTWETKVQDVLADLWELPDKYVTEHATLNDLSGMKIGLGPHPYARMYVNTHPSFARI